MRTIFATCVLLLLTALIFRPVGTYEFVDYDDTAYVTENLQVQGGLTWEGFQWAFRNIETSNWHPLTWISHMLDVELFGMDAGRHHLINVTLHLLNAALLFFLLRGMSGSVWRSALVAALFAVHPLHVESVAWVSERKDVLSTSFWLLTLVAYLQYVRKPEGDRYCVLIVVLACGLLSKPMLVTLPFVLLLLDYWPLGRWGSMASPRKAGAFPLPGMPGRRVLYEKLPLLVLAVTVSAITYYAQQKGGALKSMEMYSLQVRVANAFVSYVKYVLMTLWPARLAVLYPHPGISVSLWQAAVSAVLLLSVSALAVRFRKTGPYLPVGWFWYVGTLVPVIGLVQVGQQAMADRYTYVPLMGLFILAVWSVSSLLAQRRHALFSLSLSAAVLAAFALPARLQVYSWQDSMTLYEHALRNTSHNHIMHNNLGALFAAREDYEKAAVHFSEALRIKPNYTKAYFNLSQLRGLERDEEIVLFREALGEDPENTDLHARLGDALFKQKRFGEAVTHYREAARREPGSKRALSSLGNALARRGKHEEALTMYRRVLEISPDDAEIYNKIGLVLSFQGRFGEARAQFREALRFRPDYAVAYFNLGNVYFTQGNYEEAAHSYREALRISPDYAMAYNSLGKALHKQGRYEEAIGNYRQALLKSPDMAEAQWNLERARQQRGK